MSNDIAILKQLREISGAGMGDCKKALTETGNNIEEAMVWLRKKGMASAAKKADRVASEGLVGINIQGTQAVILELNSETDFVAKNESFRGLIKEILSLTISANSLEDALSTKIGEVAIEEKVAESSGIIGEKLALRRFKKVSVKNGVIASYIHTSEMANTGKTCVLLGVESESTNVDALNELGKKLCMQAAAMRPRYLHSSEVETSVLEKEKRNFTRTVGCSKKSRKLLLKKFLKEKLQNFTKIMYC